MSTVYSDRACPWGFERSGQLANLALLLVITTHPLPQRDECWRRAPQQCAKGPCPDLLWVDTNCLITHCPPQQKRRRPCLQHNVPFKEGDVHRVESNFHPTALLCRTLRLYLGRYAPTVNATGAQRPSNSRGKVLRKESLTATTTTLRFWIVAVGQPPAARGHTLRWRRHPRLTAPGPAHRSCNSFHRGSQDLTSTFTSISSSANFETVEPIAEKLMVAQRGFCVAGKSRGTRNSVHRNAWIV